MNLNPLLMLWSGLLLATVAVSVVRWNVGHKEDDHLHYMDTDAHLVAAQAATAQRLSVLDRWRRVLLAVTLLVGLGLAAAHLYKVWEQGAGLVN
ncbi:MAG TPA: hypothetical protein VER03_18220 [Bryobacteraceae bacterium]|nr:hypothetical protein [Bryobacteraceae bacterium]